MVVVFVGEGRKKKVLVQVLVDEFLGNENEENRSMMELYYLPKS